MKSYSFYLIINFMLKQRSVNFMFPECLFWVLLCRGTASGWTWLWSVWWWIGPLLLAVSKFNASWGLLTFIDVVFVTSVQLLLPCMH